MDSPDARYRLDGEKERIKEQDRIHAPADSASDSRLATADLYARAGDYSQALSTYLGLWHRSSGEGLLALARRIAYCQARLGRHGEAVALLESVLADYPDFVANDSDVCLELGRCYQLLGNAQFMIGELEEAQAAGLKSSHYLERFSTPDFGITQNLLGGVARRSGDVDLARTHFRSALEHFRGLGDVGNLALAYNNLGNVYLQLAEWERALEHYQVAYYLRATEGEYESQAPIHRNIGVANMKIGRYDEAREHFEKSLERSVELGDAVRALRARIELAMLGRESLDLKLARQYQRESRQSNLDPMPQREAILLDLEEARLLQIEENYTEARARLDSLRERASVAGREDLMVEVQLLQAGIALDQGAWSEAGEALQAAFELSKTDHDREQENRALAGQMRLAFLTGDNPAAEKLFSSLMNRYKSRGERPAIARLLSWRGDSAYENEKSSERAVEFYADSRDLWRRMGLSHVEAVLELKVAQCLIDIGRREEAASVIESLQDREAGTNNPVFEALVVNLGSKLDRELDPKTNGVPEGERALRKLEEILGWDAEPAEKLRGAVNLVLETLGADGAVLARIEEDDLEVVSSVSMGRLGGKRSLSKDALGLESVEHARVLGSGFADSQSEVRSALVVPVDIHGKSHILFLERREAAHRRYTPSDLSFASLLVAEVARSVPRTPQGLGDEELGDGMDRVRHGIYVADIITQDTRMLSILSLIRKIASSDLTVLLQGETGTGKKLLAQAIHRVSDRRNQPFVTVDCAALPDNLLESELFGHRKGAFTGATQDRIGLLEEANGGTIFLDEIDKAGLAVQRRFLHMLDSGEIRPVGSTGYRSLDVRVVCATSCPELRNEVAEGKFIKDLYYRLNDISIAIPALRDRPDDVVLLTECFLEKFGNELGREFNGVTPQFYDAIRAHNWPGNVRELEKAIRRAVTLADDGITMSPESLPVAVLESSQSDADVPRAGSLRDRVEQVEKEIIVQTLDRLRWNKSRAASDLGLSRKGLKGKMERYRIDRRARR